MQLDTGASGITLSKSGASRLGLTREEHFKTGGIGDKGDVDTSTAHAASIKIGNLEFRNCQVEMLEKGSALDTAGLLGADIFRNYLITLDIPKLTMKLDPLPKRPGETAPESHALANAEAAHEPGTEAADDDADEPAYDRYIAPEMKSWSPMVRVGHEILIPVFINSHPSGLFLIDTGTSSMLISPAAAGQFTKVKRDPDSRIGGLSGEVKEVYETGKFTFQFAGLQEKFDNMTSIDTTHISHNSGVEVSGLLGAPILFRLTVHLDYRDNLIKFEYSPFN